MTAPHELPDHCPRIPANIPQDTRRLLIELALQLPEHGRRLSYPYFRDAPREVLSAILE